MKIISKWTIVDYDGRREGVILINKSEKISKCKNLYEWIRCGNYTIRWRVLWWHLGLDDSVVNVFNYDQTGIEGIIAPVLDKIDVPLFEFAKEVQAHLNTDAGKFAYQYCLHSNNSSETCLTKLDTDKMTINQIWANFRKINKPK